MLIEMLSVNIGMKRGQLRSSPLKIACTLPENLSLFYPCTDTLWKNEIECSRIINLAEEISEHFNVQDVE